MTTGMNKARALCKALGCTQAKSTRKALVLDMARCMSDTRLAAHKHA